MKVCDRCKKRVKDNNFEEWQEFFHIDFTGGYNSVFGDGNKVKCDLCQSCLKEIIEGFCRIKTVEF